MSLNSSLNWKITSCRAALSFMRQQLVSCENTIQSGDHLKQQIHAPTSLPTGPGGPCKPFGPSSPLSPGGPEGPGFPQDPMSPCKTW